jgi:hypothetical protein
MVVVLRLIIVCAEDAERCVVVDTDVEETLSVKHAKHVICAFKVGIRVQLDYPVRMVDLN